jgi:predicted anti-sigma-YlaC factor YlaD
MSRQRQGLSPDVHSEAWWVRLMDDDLTVMERVRWETHLEQCPRCQAEWNALACVDDLLRFAPAVPALSVGFAAETVDRIIRRQRLRKLLAVVGGALIVLLVTTLVFVYVGSALGTLERGLGALVAARQVLLRSGINMVLVLFFGWRAILPFFLGLVAMGYILLMPNGLVFTAALIWLSGHRRAAAPVQA